MSDLRNTIRKTFRLQERRSVPNGITKMYTIEASPNVIRNFENFLAHLQYCAGVGHSCVVGMDIDGDGADRFNVQSPDLPKGGSDAKELNGHYEKTSYHD